MRSLARCQPSLAGAGPSGRGQRAIPAQEHQASARRGVKAPFGRYRRLQLLRRTSTAASASFESSAAFNDGDDEDAPPSAPGALDAEWQALLSSRAAAGLGGEPASEDDGGPEASSAAAAAAASDSGPQNGGGEAVGGGPGAAAVGFSWPSSASVSSASADDTYDWLDEAGYTPFPSNLPADVGGGFGKDGSSKDTNGVVGSSPVSSFLSSTAFSTNLSGGAGASAGSEQLSWQHTSTPVATPPLPWEESPRTVYVILFGVGGAMGTEGIYALRAVVSDEESSSGGNASSSSPSPSSLDADAPLPHDTIVAFECEDDALRYASQLEAAGMDKHAPSVSAIDSAELLDFCSDAGYDARLEARNTSLLPPECSVGLTDWERSARLRRGAWSVLPSDPEFGEASPPATPSTSSAPSSSSPAAAHSPSPSPPSTPRLRNNAGAYSAGSLSNSNSLNHLSPLAAEGDAALAELRAMLERLLESSPSSDSPSASNNSSWATDDFEGDDLGVV